MSWLVLERGRAILYKEDFGEGKNIEFKREIPKRH